MNHQPKTLVRWLKEPACSGFTALAASLLLVACSTEPHSDLDPTPSVPTRSDSVRFVDPPSGPGAMAPNLVTGRDGVLLSWLEPTAERPGHALLFSTLEGEDWTPPRMIASGDQFFANWTDLPEVAEAADGTRFAHWLRKLGDDTYAYGAALARSSDGETWDEVGLLHDDASPTEHGFVSYASLPAGGIQAFWLDGRAMLEGQGMQLRTTVLDADGPRPSEILDDQVCECCATDAALAATGPVVVYRDRSATEIRDIAVIRATGEGWSKPVMIHDDGWQIHGCPVNGPAIAADGDRVAVAWFTAAGSQASVKVALSDDAGVSFTAPIVVDDAEPLGRVDAVFGPRGRAVVSWLGSAGEGAEIRWRTVSPGGDIGSPHIVAATTANRSAGVPRMVRLGDELLFAWVEDAEPSTLRTGLVSLR